MANPNPFKARQGRKRRQQEAAGSLADLQAALWRAIERLDASLTTGPGGRARGVDDKALRRMHALCQLGGVYMKALEVGELEARIAALEKANART